jgi:selenocysteine lyase/cysteine desulfurase
VRDAAEQWLAGWDANGAEWPFWVERNEAARAAFAGIVRAEPDDVAVTTSVSQAVSALVSALDLSGDRNRIVISEYEFPTVGQIAHAQELRGAEVVHVEPDSDGRIPLERFAEAVNERTALVCSTFVSFRTGHRHDVQAIAEIAHASGALHLADSYQAIGAVDVDVRTLRADIVTGGTVKYLLGSAGLAFMWLRDSLRPELLPTQTGWFADEDIFAMSIADYSPHATARRFDSGTPPVPSLYPGVAGMELIAEVGVAAIEAHIRSLVDRLLEGLDELGATVVTPRGEGEYGPMVCVLSTDPNALVDALAADRIVVSTRDSNLRMSFHAYNVEEDVDRILAALAANRALLA